VELESIPVKSDKTASRIIDKEAVIVLLEKQETMVLNEVGSRIWEAMDGANDVAGIARQISVEFDTTYSQAQDDALEFVEDLRQRGAVLIK